jgi:nitrogen fixation protein FixH
MYTFFLFVLSVALLAWLEGALHTLIGLAVVERTRHHALCFNRVIVRNRKDGSAQQRVGRYTSSRGLVVAVCSRESLSSVRR